MNTNQSNQPQTSTAPISQPINPPPTTQTPPQPASKKKTSWLLITIIIFFLSATGVLGYKYYELKQQFDNQQTLPTPTPQLVDSSPSPIVSPTAEVGPTADWKTHTNSIHGISFKYPQPWNIVEQAGQKEGDQIFNTKIELNKDEAKITIYLNMDGIGGKGQNYEGKKFILDGVDLYQYSKINSYNNTQTIGLSNSLTNTLGFFMIDDITYSITLNYPDSYSNSQRSLIKAEFDQILNTFQFID